MPDSALVMAATRRIDAATGPRDLFGNGDPKKIFRELARAVHPDSLGGDLAERAAESFSRLRDLYELAKSDGAEISGIGWDAAIPLSKGRICDVYAATQDGVEAALKIARRETDGDLMEREATALRVLHERAVSPYEKYIPLLVETFATTYGPANAVTLAQGFTLQSIASHFKGGVPFRHIVWMGNRLWSALGYAHHLGVIHGACLPQHLMYRPNDHGLTLLDWTASVQFPDPAGKIPYRIEQHADSYPPEVAAGDCSPATDIYMAASTLLAHSEPPPSRFLPIFEWCRAASPSARPSDAWALQDLWSETAKREYGKPAFVELNLPIN